MRTKLDRMKRFPFVLLVVLTVPPLGLSEPSGGNYLPLEVGNKWELHSPVTDKPIVFEVVGKADSAFRVRWDNPWIPAELQFVSSGDQVSMQAINMGEGVYTLPSPLVYFDFDAAENATWSNAVGKMTILSRHKTVSTTSKQYEHCIEIQITDEKGESNYWTFAPNVGFVQFGQGREAFVLSSFSRSRSSHPAHPTSFQSLLIGIDAIPSSVEGYSPEAIRKSLQTAVNAGMTYMHMAPKWNEMEPKPGLYNFEDPDSSVNRAEEHNLPLELGIRIIDTNQRSTPDTYKNWAWDDPRMAEKLNDLLQALGPRLKGRARWVAIGNEVNAYFDDRKAEIDQYARLLDRVIGTVRTSFPGALFTVNFTSDAVSRLQSDYKAITSKVDFISFTYYPLNADFAVKEVDQVKIDLQRMIDAAGDRKVLFQEIGCPSARSLKSSEEKQAKILEQVFHVLKENKDRVMAANILWMSDIPDSLVEQFGQYYQLPNSENFKAYLATLGLFDQQGKAKLAWRVFEREAHSLAPK